MSSQSLNGANSSRRTREVLKKGKSSEFNPRDYEQLKSSQSLTVWSYKGSNLYPINGSIGLKQGCCTGLYKNFQGQVKMFQGPTTYNYPISIEKSNLSFPVWTHEYSTFKKRRRRETVIFPVLQKLTHIYTKCKTLYIDAIEL